MSRSGRTAGDGVGRRYPVPSERIRTSGGSLLVAAGGVGLYRPLSTAYATLDAVSSQFAPLVGGVLFAFAAALALWGARGTPKAEGTLGAGLVGGTLLGALVVVGLYGRLSVLGPGTLTVGFLATLAAAAMSGIVAVWTVRGARSRVEALAFGTPAAFPVLAGPYFAAFAPETVPVGTTGPAGVLALAAGVVLGVGVAYGLYRRSVRLAAADDARNVENRNETREV